MNDEKAPAVHWSFWAIGSVALIWHLMGVLNYLGQHSAEVVAQMPETHRAIIESRPAWATGGFATAVFGGALGCVLLLLRRAASYYLFIASLVGVIVTMVHTLRIAASTVDFSAFEITMMVAMPLLVGAFLIGYSKRAQQYGWLRSANN